MQAVTTIGLDIAKSVFQVHGIDAAGKVVVRRQLKRRSVGRKGVEQLLGVVADGKDKRLPELARACVAALGAQLTILKDRILEFDRLIMAWHRSSEASKRLDDIPGVGPALAPRWWPVSLIRRRSARAGTSWRGSGSSPNSIAHRVSAVPGLVAERFRDRPDPERGRRHHLQLIRGRILAQIRRPAVSETTPS
jgi:transposase